MGLSLKKSILCADKFKSLGQFLKIYKFLNLISEIILNLLSQILMTSSSDVVIIISIFHYDEIWYIYLVDFYLVYYFVVSLFSNYNEISIRNNRDVTFTVSAN